MKNQSIFYNIHPILETHFNKIPKNIDIILHVCIYTIQKSSSISFTYNPFLKYLLYKHPDKHTTHSNMLTFPFIKLNTTNNVLMESKKIFEQITKTSSKPLGFIQNNENVYVFFEYKEENNNVNMLTKKDDWWWALICEMCNSKKVDQFTIHSSVYTIFYKNPTLLYILNSQHKPYEIPTIGYYGITSELLTYVSTLGIKSSSEREFGPYYYFGNFIKATRRAGWSSNYKNIFISNKKITNENGRYKQGGYVRFALFLGITKVILYRKTSEFSWFIGFFDKKTLNEKESKNNIKKLTDIKGKWTNNYDSLIISNIKYKNLSGYFNINKEIILKDFNRFTALSTHLLDKSTLKNIWDPFHEKYNIL